MTDAPHISPLDQARILSEALPHMQRYDEETLVIKDGGHAMGAADLAYRLMERPGAFIYLGNGGRAGLHHPAYDFNDAVIPVGSSYWVRLVETALPAG